MNVSEIEIDELKPTMLMVFYENKEKAYAEYAEIQGEHIGLYRPVVYELFDKFSQKLKERKASKVEAPLSFKGMIPRNVVAFNSDKMMAEITWVVPSAVRKIYLGEKEAYLKYPHLMFSVRRNHLYMYALKSTNIVENMQLYICPFSNIYENGTMCFGTISKNKLFKGSYKQIMENMEDAFFNSIFTHTLMQDMPTKVPTLALLEDCISKDKTKAKAIPVKYLKPYKLLKNVLN